MLRVFEFGISEKRKEENENKKMKGDAHLSSHDLSSFWNIKRLTILHGNQ